MVSKEDTFAYIDANIMPTIEKYQYGIFELFRSIVVNSFTYFSDLVLSNGNELKVYLWAPAYLVLYEMVNTPGLALVVYPTALIEILVNDYSYGVGGTDGRYYCEDWNEVLLLDKREDYVSKLLNKS